MPDFLFLMHEGASGAPEDWKAYLDALGQKGVLQGGSAIGGGTCLRKAGPAPAISRNIVGYIKVQADDLAAAQALLAGNPVYEGGGAVEVRELPAT